MISKIHNRVTDKKRIFNNNIRRILHTNGIQTHDDFDWFNLKKRNITYLAAAKQKSIPGIYNSLHMEPGITNCQLFHADWMEFIFFQSNKGLFGFIFALKDEYISLDQEVFNQNRQREILNLIALHGKRNGLSVITHIDEISSILIFIADFHIMANTFAISFAEVENIFVYNTHREFKKIYLEHLKNITHGDSKRHIDEFCRLYYRIIKVISQTVSLTNPLVIHDVGTNSAQLPLLLSGMTRKQLLGINVKRIIASDIGWTASREVTAIINKNGNYTPITFITLDIVKQVKKIPPADVVVIIDVFEHLKNNAVCRKALSALWNQTKKILIMHVPFETRLNKGWGHNILFDAEKLRSLSRGLSGGTLLSDHYRETDKKTLTEHGFLIVKKGSAKRI
jgi:hypothetical protein